MAALEVIGINHEVQSTRRITLVVCGRGRVDT